ncbi:MAG: hypothetical protein V1799_05675 [bacterium]
MRTMIFRFSLDFIILLMFTACREGVVLPQTVDELSNSTRVNSTAFQFVIYGDVSSSQVSGVYEALVSNNERIKKHLHVTDMPQVKISLWSEAQSSDFYSQMKSRIGQIYPGATGYTPSAREICLLWNSSAPTGVVHEYAHLVSIALRPTIGNNPRWLWEAIAQYEARMFDHPSRWSLEQRKFPGFSALNQFNSELPYRWGYYLAAFILERWGDDGYINLILTNGNISNSLGATEKEFGILMEEYIKRLVNS